MPCVTTAITPVTKLCVRGTQTHVSHAGAKRTMVIIVTSMLNGCSQLCFMFYAKDLFLLR